MLHLEMGGTLGVRRQAPGLGVLKGSSLGVVIDPERLSL